MDLTQKKRLFKWVSILEALSFLILLFLAVPLKYFFDSPQMVEVMGMVHGVLFILYFFGAIYMYPQLPWRFKQLLLILLCSVIPFGPFYVEKKYL